MLPPDACSLPTGSTKRSSGHSGTRADEPQLASKPPAWKTRTPSPLTFRANARVASSFERIGAPRGLSDVLMSSGTPVASPTRVRSACRNGSSRASTVCRRAGVVVVADAGGGQARARPHVGRVQHVPGFALPIEPSPHRFGRHERGERAIKLALFEHVIDEIVAAPCRQGENTAVAERARANLALTAVQEDDVARGEPRDQLLAHVRRPERGFIAAVGVAQERQRGGDACPGALVAIVEQRPERLPRVVAAGRQEQRALADRGANAAVGQDVQRRAAGQQHERRVGRSSAATLSTRSSSNTRCTDAARSNAVWLVR